MRPWIKLWCELLGDPQFLAMCEQMQARWMKLLLMREYGDLRKLTDWEIADGLHISLTKLHETHRTLVAKGWVTEDWDIPKWDARQGPTDPGAAERMRRHRRNVARNGSVDAPVTSHAPARESKLEGEENRSDRARAPAVTIAEPDRTGPDPTGLPPEVAAALRLALKLGGNGWDGWAWNEIRNGCPPAWIVRALETLSRRHEMRQPLASKILADWRIQGGPPSEPGAPPPKPAPPAVKPRWMPSTGASEDVYSRMWKDLPADLSQKDAEQRSGQCPACEGLGMALIYARGGDHRAVRTHCICPLGEWMRVRMTPEDLRGLPDLCDVMTGKSAWTTVRAEEESDGPDSVS